MISLSILTAATFPAWGQILKPAEYQNSKLNHFIGEWKWTSGDQTFSIKLAKIKFDSSIAIAVGKSEDLIVGWHEGRYNGKLVVSSFKQMVKQPSTSFTIFAQQSSTAEKLYLMITDYDYGIFGLPATLELIPGSPDRAIWKSADPSPDPDTENERYWKQIIAPSNIVLEKVK